MRKMLVSMEIPALVAQLTNVKFVRCDKNYELCP